MFKQWCVVTWMCVNGVMLLGFIVSWLSDCAPISEWITTFDQSQILTWIVNPQFMIVAYGLILAGHVWAFVNQVFAAPKGNILEGVTFVQVPEICPRVLRRLGLNIWILQIYFDVWAGTHDMKMRPFFVLAFLTFMDTIILVCLRHALLNVYLKWQTIRRCESLDWARDFCDKFVVASDEDGGDTTHQEYEDQSVYMDPKRRDAIWFFFLQLLLTIIFIADAEHQSGHKVQKIEDDPDNTSLVIGEVKLSFWITGILCQLFAAGSEENMGSPFSFQRWCQIDTDEQGVREGKQVGEADGKERKEVRHTWNGKVVENVNNGQVVGGTVVKEQPLWDRKEVRFAMDHFINSVAWTIILYFIPIVGAISDSSDDFLQNVLVFVFIVKVDNVIK